MRPFVALSIECFEGGMKYLPIRQKIVRHPHHRFVWLVDVVHVCCAVAVTTGFVKHALCQCQCCPVSTFVFVPQWHRETKWGVFDTPPWGSVRLVGEAGWGVREGTCFKFIYTSLGILWKLSFPDNVSVMWKYFTFIANINFFSHTMLSIFHHLTMSLCVVYWQSKYSLFVCFPQETQFITTSVSDNSFQRNIYLVFMKSFVTFSQWQSKLCCIMFVISLLACPI